MKTTIKTLVIIFLLFSNSLIFAQVPLNPGQDPGATPINDYLIPMVLLGVALGYRLVRKKTQKVL